MACPVAAIPGIPLDGTVETQAQRRYRIYMHSPQWDFKRRMALARDGYACKECGSTRRLEVHHLTYIHFGNEKLDEIISLCRVCHEKHHKKMRRGGLRQFSKKR
jgi:5-methylcytosine-specific restriction endonuclease McrA